ncbi:hypothetical protein STRCR_0402 [Streptococcus criceti HS-6]|uniref:Uncharacterized protein n=1 Tax=Streptococcus criceti HS-6 TaxID=873449 RepID=G5JPP7_STRCG|nr:hypothetical protein STRCR_0402 [Streptococcus criceti HS-6]
MSADDSDSSKEKDLFIVCKKLPSATITFLLFSGFGPVLQPLVAGESARKTGFSRLY